MQFKNKPVEKKAYKQQFVIGRKPLLEALQQGITFERVFIQKGASGAEITSIIQEAKKQQLAVNMVPAEKMDSFTKANHQGVLGIAALVTYYNLQDIIDQTISNGKQPLFIMLDGITDVRNIGAIARTALAFGVQGIIIPDKGVGALNEDAVKTSAGALLQIPICRVGSLMKTVDELHLNGIAIYGSEMTATINVKDLPKDEPCCIIVGSEDKGIFPPLLKICDKQFNITMPGNVESLNVSVAAGIILYEIKR
jgi:23S rRNA (guanosine2251-2'-O)-methyltransferase